MGREQVKFASFLGQAEKGRNSPSPSAYRIKTEVFYSKRGGKMAAKLPSVIDLATRKKTPGPGSYKLDIT